jgi:hypothetical protein
MRRAAAPGLASPLTRRLAATKIGILPCAVIRVAIPDLLARFVRSLPGAGADLIGMPRVVVFGHKAARLRESFDVPTFALILITVERHQVVTAPSFSGRRRLDRKGTRIRQ